MKHKALHLLFAAMLAAAPAWSQRESIPYYNPGEDLSTVTSVVDATYTAQCTPWSVYTMGAGNGANKTFSYVPGYKGNYDWTAGGTVWTKALDVKDGKAYKVTVVMGSTFNGFNYDLVRPHTEINIALYATPEYKAQQTEIFRQKGVGPFDTSNRPSYTAYFRGDTSKPYLGFGNRGGGNVSRFSVDDIRVIEVDGATPATASDLALSASGKTVDVSFKLPVVSVINENLSEIQSVKLMRGGVVIKEWKNQVPGAEIKYTDNLTSVAQYTYSVVCGNNGSYGETVSSSIMIPLGDNNVSPTITGEYGVDESHSNGYFGRNYNAHAVYVPGEGVKVKYAFPLYAYKVEEIPEGEDKTFGTVTRMSDNKLLVENSDAGEVMDTDIDENARSVYQYKVDLTRSFYEQTAYSSILSLNNPMPFLPGMAKPALDEFTCIDGDGDMTNWSYGTSGSGSNQKRDVTEFFTCSNSYRTNPGDDWLITPGLIVEKGKTYRVDIDAFSAGLIEQMVQFMVSVGKSNTIEAMTDEIIPLTKLKHLGPATYSGYYTADYTGNAFFGLRSYNGISTLGISRIEIYEVPEELPVAVDMINIAYSVTPGKATLSFNAPSKNIVGGDLESLEKIELYRNDSLFETISAPKPGELISKEITFEVGAQDEYKVIPYTSAGAGLSTSTKVMVIEAPYSNSFDNESDITGYTIIDANEGGYTWGYMAVNKAMRSFPDGTGHNDYLITPPIHLEKGQFYKVDFLTWLASADKDKYYNNRIEVLLGTSPTVEAMTTTIMKPVGVYGGLDGKMLAKEWFTVPETGEYYIAWHSISDKGMAQELYIDEINISDKIPGTYPGPVTDFVVAPDPEGDSQVEISYKIPVNDMLGNPLQGTVYNTVLYRDGVQLKNQMAQQPGTEIGYTDTKVPQGVHTYTVTCYGYADGVQTGTRDMDAQVYVGINIPAPVPSVEVVENPDRYGEVTISWEAPVSDADGFPLNTSNVTYTIGRYIVDNFNGTSYPVVYEQNFKPGADGKLEYTKVVTDDASQQEFMRFYVLPNTPAGSAKTAILSHYIAVGAPFSLPYTESFRNSNCEHSMLQDYPWPSYSMASWGYGAMNPTTGVKPVDGDNGLLVMQVEWAEQGARLYTPRISLNVEKPVMTFYVYNQTTPARNDNNVLGISLREGEGEFVTVESKTIDEWAGGKHGWQKAVVDLSDYAGKNVYVALDGRAYNMTFIHVDRIRIGSPVDSDISLTSLTSDRVYVGVDHNAYVYVKNNGGKTIESAKVGVRIDGKTLGVKTVGPIEPAEEITVDFVNCFGRDALGHHVYTAEAILDGDEDNFDNKSEDLLFTVIENDFPTVENLEGVQEGENITLTWKEPVLPDTPQEITDDFEKYPAWSTMYTGIGDYTLVDNDKQGIGGFSDIELPNVTIGSKQSFTLWDFSIDYFQFEGAAPTYRAHSGDKCLVSVYNVTADGYLAYTDDRIISPLLPGNAQTISFYAKSISDYYPDDFTVYYSFDGLAFEDFQKHSFPEETVAGTWKKFSYDLPEGTKYFMIRHWCGNGRFFFIDDITYTPVGDETLMLQGYNVYRENEKLTASPAKNLTWIDNDPKVDASNNYSVSAVYDRGESPVATVSVEMSGVDSAFGESVKVYAQNSEIVITGAQGLDFSVVNASGMVVTQRKAENVTRVPVQPGVYVVTVAGKPVKLIVK